MTNEQKNKLLQMTTSEFYHWLWKRDDLTVRQKRTLGDWYELNDRKRDKRNEDMSLELCLVCKEQGKVNRVKHLNSHIVTQHCGLEKKEYEKRYGVMVRT